MAMASVVCCFAVCCTEDPSTNQTRGRAQPTNHFKTYFFSFANFTSFYHIPSDTIVFTVWLAGVVVVFAELGSVRTNVVQVKTIFVKLKITLFVFSGHLQTKEIDSKNDGN